MSLKKCLLISSVFYIPAAFAHDILEFHPNQSNFETSFGGGYTFYEGFTNNHYGSRMQGYNTSANVLLPVMKNSILVPVIGIGINYSDVKSASTFNLGSERVKAKIRSLSAEGDIGVKINPLEKLSIYLLGKGAYSFYNGIKNTETVNSRTAINKHFFAGLNIAGTYNIFSNINLGASLSYNRHFMKSKSEKANTNFNEYSANLIATLNF